MHSQAAFAVILHRLQVLGFVPVHETPGSSYLRLDLTGADAGYHILVSNRVGGSLPSAGGGSLRPCTVPRMTPPANAARRSPAARKVSSGRWKPGSLPG